MMAHNHSPQNYGAKIPKNPAVSNLTAKSPLKQQYIRGHMSSDILC